MRSRNVHWNKDLLWTRSGRIVAVARMGYSDNDKAATWMCLCDCGNYVIVRGSNLNTGKTKSCGCLKKEVDNFKNKLRPFESLFNWFTFRSETLGCDISYEDFLEFTNTRECHYCGGPVTWAEFNINANGSNYNIDRKDNSRGYYKDNCVVCCIGCNSMKSSLNYDEFLQKIRQIVKHLRIDV